MRYYLANDGVQQGPFEMNELVSKGLRADSLVWTDGMKDWARADTVPEVAALLAPVPAAAPASLPPSEPVNPAPAAPAPTTPPLQPLGTIPYHPALTEPTNGMAVASLVLGILSIPLICARGAGIALGILAIIFGFIARSKPEGRNSGMAMAGIILGFVPVIIVGFFMCVGLVFFRHRGMYRIFP